MNKRVVVGLSGGVDSSVAALLLKLKGYEVIGIFIRNWYEKNLRTCSWIEDSIDAMLVAKKIGIPFQIIDLSKEYKNNVIDYMFNEYSIGRTPNPDILCNRKIKFDIFWKKAQLLGANFMATGHYAQIKVCCEKKIIYRLLSGKDNNKDQSYFLCQLNQYQLDKIIFPLGKFTKKEVRIIATKAGLITAKKKDSQGLCFVGKIRLPDFLKSKLKLKKGDIVEIPSDSEIYKKQKYNFLSKNDYLNFLSKRKIYKKTDGKIIGQHIGACVYTIGQRKWLGVGGYKKALFVIDTDINNNIVYVGMSNMHPGLYKKVLFINNKELHWIRNDLSIHNGEKLEVSCRIRYRQSLQKATLYKVDNGMYIEFKNNQIAITKGQFAVWYLGEEVIGSGIIS
ncbi:MAG: tRNA 2-thiouridine(34) synthase MnmA [Candidatus Bostrichicola ureolyticus]|nr:MAG: tRNA 2-thiouridine(34) synthase MnmA [Candidatus Bostrichicola ureolyticus]